jgi:hypothetical protein
MRIPTDILLGVLLWGNAAAFLLGFVAGFSFETWIAFDIVAMLVCGLIGFAKQLLLLQIVAGFVIVAFVLRFSLPLWMIIDLFVIGSCGYVGYLFCVGKIDRIKTPSP